MFRIREDCLCGPHNPRAVGNYLPTATHALECSRRATGCKYGVGKICIGCCTKRAVQGGLTGTLQPLNVGIKRDVEAKIHGMPTTNPEKALTGRLKRVTLTTVESCRTRAPRIPPVTTIEARIELLETTAYIGYFMRVRNHLKCLKG